MKNSRWVKDAVVIFKVQGHRNEYGESTGDREKRVRLKCVTHPVSGESGVLERMPEGARLSDCRTFYINVGDIKNIDQYLDYGAGNKADPVTWRVGAAISQITVPEPVTVPLPGTLSPTKDDAIEYNGRVYEVKEVEEWDEDESFLVLQTLRVPC